MKISGAARGWRQQGVRPFFIQWELNTIFTEQQKSTLNG
jgi:hypothetical protein